VTETVSPFILHAIIKIIIFFFRLNKKYFLSSTTRPISLQILNVFSLYLGPFFVPYSLLRFRLFVFPSLGVLLVKLSSPVLFVDLSTVLCSSRICHFVSPLRPFFFFQSPWEFPRAPNKIPLQSFESPYFPLGLSTPRLG